VPIGKNRASLGCEKEARRLSAFPLLGEGVGDARDVPAQGVVEAPAGSNYRSRRQSGVGRRDGSGIIRPAEAKTLRSVSRRRRDRRAGNDRVAQCPFGTGDIWPGIG
jgi:hypothetical protein